MEREVRYCTTKDGVRIAYCVEGKGPPMLMTPFLLESFVLDDLSPGQQSFIRRLCAHFRLIRYDSRNIGSSQRGIEKIGFEELILEIEGVLDATADGPTTLIGRGPFGPAAIACAARRPELIHRLILYGTAPALQDNYSADALRGLAQMARANWPVTARTLADFSGRREFGDAGLQNAELYLNSTTGEEAAIRIEGTMDTDASAYLAQVRCPTLVVHPMNDGSWAQAPAQRMAAAIPDAVFVPVKGSFHQVAFGDPEPVLSAILSFVGLSDRVEARPQPAPSDSVRTVLFTDLVGHTEMMSRLGDERGRGVLREHERITREVLKANGGTEVKTMGDGFMASFGSVTKAVECAIALQRAFEALTPDPSPAAGEGQHVESLKIRCGLNAGEPIEEDGDLFGAMVILASRIAAKADGGEILVADTVRGLCSGKGFLFADRGEFVAKGFEEPVRVYEVNWREQ